MSVNIGGRSLLIVPAGFNPATGFGSYTSRAGSIRWHHVNVPAGKGFGGWGSINDPVVCQGTIAAASGGVINLDNGLVLSGNGSVSLGPMGC